MQRRGDICIGPGQFIKTRDGFAGAEGLELDIVLLQDMAGRLRHNHQPRYAAANHQDRRPGRDDGFEVLGAYRLCRN